MCLVTVALIATVAAAGVTAYGQIQQGNAQAKAYKYNAQVEEENAAQAKSAAASQANQVDRDNRRKIAEAMAAYGASGVDPNWGSPLDVMSDLATEGELSKRLVLYQGDLDARASNQRATLDRMQAKSAQTAGYISAGATVLGAVGKVAGGYSSASVPSSVNVTPQVMGSKPGQYLTW